MAIKFLRKFRLVNGHTKYGAFYNVGTVVNIFSPNEEKYLIQMGVAELFGKPKEPEPLKMQDMPNKAGTEKESTNTGARGNNARKTPKNKNGKPRNYKKK